MRLETALYSSSSGMNAHGSAIAAIGDNISNVNTTGFKGQRTEFASLVSGGLSGGTASTFDGGGGGVRVAGIRSVHQAGAIEDTGRDLDLSIDGEGFFVVGSPDAPLYTRAGNFLIDADGNLSLPTGQQVLGFTGAADGEQLAALGPINLLEFDTSGVPTSTLAISGNINSNSPITAVPANAASFKEVNAAASFIANATTVDSLGNLHPISIAYFKTGNGTYTANVYMDGGELGGEAGVPSLLGTANLTFDENGLIPEANQAAAQIAITPAYGNGATAGNITIDVSKFTQFSSLSSLGSVATDGLQSGALTGYEIENNGNVIARLDNGSRVVVASIALATFNNVDGLKKIGDNMFQVSNTTGDPNIGTAASDARGGVRGGSLERSTVDLGTEFPNLITIQRGYQANSKMLGTVKQMLDQAISLLG